MREAPRRTPARRLMTMVAAVATAAVPVAGVATSAHAAASDVVISEIHYHPIEADPAANAEFIELTNKGTEDVDLGGWSFTAGITIVGTTLPSGTVLAPGGRIVGSSDPAVFTTKYGFAPDFSFAGSKLSNDGERVTLVDSAAAVVDDLTYDDAAPWPVAPDGSGPSLELDGLDLDNSLAVNWHASTLPWGTPRAANTIAPLDVLGVAPSTTAPDANTPVTITAHAPVGSTLTLSYKIMYAADVTVPMTDAVGDGTFTADLPGAGEGELMRYKVNAVKGASTGSYPTASDSRPYDGVVVKDSELASATWPVLQWFMSDEVYNDMLTNHVCDDFYAPATVAYNGVVLDGTMMRIKGHGSCGQPKAKWDVELPTGYTLDFGSPYGYPLKQFHLNDETMPRPRLAWEMHAQSGEVTPAYQTFRVQRNGSFQGNYPVMETYDSVWRKAHGYGSATFYKVEANGLKTYATPELLRDSLDLDKKNPDDADFSDIWELTQKLAAPATPARQAWLRANLDMPQIANYTASTVVSRHWDSGGKNYFIVKNPTTGRWQVLPWDMDGVLSGADQWGDFVFPTTTKHFMLWNALNTMPDFKEMHYRRVRTLADQLLTGTGIIDRFDQLTVGHESDIALDVAAWGGRSLSGTRKSLVSNIQERRDTIARHTNATEIPVSQAPTDGVVINEIQYHPSGAAEFLELHNPGATAVDMTGWTIPALGGYTMAPGSVIPAKGYFVLTNDDAALKATSSGDFILGGQYSGALDNAGETVELLDGARVVDSVTYAPTDPWPAAADGTGPSLELRDAAADNADPANWTVSTGAATQGTPGAVNSVVPVTGPVTSTVIGVHADWKYLSTSSDQGTGWRASGYDDSAWPSAPSSLGAFMSQTTTIPTARSRFTYYFRKTIDIPAGPAVQQGNLSVTFDDGAVIYLNGVELTRSNLPTGTIDYRTAAVTNTRTGITRAVNYVIPGSALQVGSNTIAVEVHQYNAGSTADVYFDAGLTITR